MVYEPPAIYGIIGNPVAHSLSPLMHNAGFQALKVNAVYKPFPLADEHELKLFLEELKTAGNPIFGLNVTVPFKEKVLPYLDSIDPFAEKAGAVNTIVVTHQRKTYGFNTDGPGLLSHLTEIGFDLKGKRLAILGAGGSTRAILAVLCLVKDRPESIKLYNRTAVKANRLINELGSKMDASIVEVARMPDDLNIELADCLINTTSVGLKGEDTLLIDPRQLHSNMLVYDLIYNPSQTALLKAALAHGAQAVNGLGMLYYQGILAFKHWSGVDIDDKYKKIMRSAVQEGARK